MFQNFRRLRTLRRQEAELLRLQTRPESLCGRDDYALPAARGPPARNHTNALVEGFGGLCPADKGFNDSFRQPLLWDRYGVKPVTPAKSNMAEQHPSALLKFCRRIRKPVETVGSRLTGRFAVDAIRAHDLRHFPHRLIRKMLAQTVMVFLNPQLGRDPLDLDGLVLGLKESHIK